MIDAIWKDGALDILVNNAAGNFIARTEDLSPRAFDSVIGIVLMGTIHCTMACGRRWLADSIPAQSLASPRPTRQLAQPMSFPPLSPKPESMPSPAASPSSGAIATFA